MRGHTEEHCHCGAEWKGSDHCPVCGCEQYEGTCDHVHVKRPITVVIHGRKPHTDKTMVDYVDHIIYGVPSEIRVAEVGDHFVAFVQWPGEQSNWAVGTFERIPSFGSFGAEIPFGDQKDAITSFGSWCYHYATVKVPAKPDWIYNG